MSQIPLDRNYTRIACSQSNKAACKERRCIVPFETPVALIDVEKLVSTHKNIRFLIREIYSRGEPPRCDCIVAYLPSTGGPLMVSSIELKGSIDWALEQDKHEALKRWAQRVVRKHISCFKLIITFFGEPSSESYNLECRTYVKSSPTLDPLKISISRILAENFRIELSRLGSFGTTVNCKNWPEGLIISCR